MARVNHKLVKQRLNEKRSKITDRQFFSSRILAGHFEDLAAAQTRRYHYNRRVRVNLYWKPKDPFLAATDNMYIRINSGNPMVSKVKGRENRYQIVCGLFAHELGHVLYTDFLAGQTHTNYLGRYKWYPYPPDLKTSADSGNERALWSYIKAEPKNQDAVQYIAHYISNVIEDGYIENRVLTNFPGTLGLGLEKARERHFEEIPTVTQLIEQEDDGSKHIFESILQLILSYAKFGEIKYGDEPLSDERIQTVFKLIPDIDSALMNKSGKERLNVVNLILVRCWEYIEEFCEICKKHQEDAVAAGSSAGIGETLSEILKSIAGGSEMGEGSSTPVPEASGGSETSATAGARAKTQEDAEESSEDEDSKEEDGSSTQTETENEENSSESGELESSEESEGSFNGPGTNSGNRKLPKAKMEESHISKRSPFPNRLEVPPKRTSLTSGSIMTAPLPILSVC